ncbi:MAG: vanadium-dependent haloperoxidase [Saprospiraceae bacterium]|nr:vanadium-dependent haloperoxidase [Saprospiraceae bacterium]
MKMVNFYRILLFSALVSSLFLTSCKDDETPVPSEFPLAKAYDYKVYKAWNEKYMQLDRHASGNRPGPGPRALAYMGLSAYEAVVPGMPENNSLGQYFPGLNLPDAETNVEYYWPACVNESYAFLMKQFFPQMADAYPDLYNSIETTRNQLHQQYAAETSPEVLARSESFGRAVAEAVYAWEQSDAAGHNAFYNPQPAAYQPPQGPGLWQPTWPDFSAAVYPYWGDVRCFAMRYDDLLAKAPIPYSEQVNSPFYTQAMETYNIVNNITSNGPGAYDAQWRAEFWSDDLMNLTFGPPTRLAAIATQVVEIENTDLATCAELYAKLGMAMSDAGVAIWKSKYYYNVERPISYIRRVIAQQYPEAANWQSLLDNPLTGVSGITPAFPAYPSGHSGFGGAGGKILSSFFEYNAEHPGTYSFTDLCHKDRFEFLGTPRSFSSFKELADEDAYSRIPLGVHFRMDCEEGVRLGELSAQRVLSLPWKK